MSKNGNGNGSETAKPTVDAKALKAAFVAYDKVNADFQTAKMALEKLNAKRGEAVKAIHDLAGKGPFGHNGQTLTIIAYADGSFTFRTPKVRDVVTVD